MTHAALCSKGVEGRRKEPAGVGNSIPGAQALGESRNKGSVNGAEDMGATFDLGRCG